MVDGFFRIYGGFGGLGFLGVWRVGVYLDPKSMQNNSPQPIKTALKAIILHTFGVQVGFWGAEV